jgi:hypothetical protein
LNQYPFLPPPYSPPTIDPRVWAIAQPNPAGRAAGLWQLILGALIFLTGSCAATAVWVVPDEVVYRAFQQQQHSQLPPVGDMSPAQEMRLIMTIASGVMIVAGGVLLILMIFVRRGGKVSTVFSIVFTGIITLILLANFVSGLMQMPGHPEVIFPLALIGGVLALSGVTIVKLIVALRSAGTTQMQAMQQAYYWMMQNQQGGMGAGGYGNTSANTPGRDAPAQSAAPLPPPPNDKI